MLFFILTFGFSIFVSMLLLLIKDVPQIVWFLLLGLSTAAPSITAIFLIYLKKGSLLNYLKQKYIKNISVKYILIGCLIPVLCMALISLFVNREVRLSDLSFHSFIIILWALFAEELGWRGYLQDYLLKKTTEQLVPLITGTVWALWHVNFYMLGTMEIPFLIFFIGCIVDSHIYFSLTKKSKGNVLPASFLHFSYNLSITLFLINPSKNNGSLTPYILTIMLFLFIALFLKYSDKQTQTT